MEVTASVDEGSGTSSADDITVTKRRGGLLNLPPSPYPIYVANLLYFIPKGMNYTAFEAALYNKLCYQHFGNITLCSNSTFTESHSALQADEARWSSYNSLVVNPLSIITNLVLSSYCDRVGHKLPYILPITGIALGYLYMGVLCAPRFLAWPMGTIFGYSVLTGLLGNDALVTTAGLSYVGLVTSAEGRPLAMALAEGAFLVGDFIAASSSGPIIDAIGLEYLYYINFGLTLLPILIILVFLTDTTSHLVEEGNSRPVSGASPVSLPRHAWMDIIGINHMLDSIKCVFRRRPARTRLVLQLSFVVYVCSYVAMILFSGTMFLYFVKEKGLSLTQYSAYNGYLSALKGFAAPLFLILVKKLINPTQSDLCMFSGVCMALGFMLTFLDAVPYGAWFGGVLLSFQSVFFAIIRAMLIGLCEKDELGKLFTYTSVGLLILGAVAGVLGKQLYAATLDVWPATFLAVCSLLYVLAMAVFTIQVRIKSVDERSQNQPS